MEDKIKSFPEYKSLVQEHKASDSVSQREAIEDAVSNTAEALLHRLVGLYAKYGRDYVDDSDFQEDRGGLSLSRFNEDKAWLHYSDRWSYGGECYIGIEVEMKYLDDNEMEALEKELRKERTMCVKRLIQEKKDAIERLKKEIEELEEEAGRLSTG